MPGIPASRLDRREQARIACRTWTTPVVLTGWGAAVEGSIEIPPAIEMDVVRPPFSGKGVKSLDERAPGARALLAALGHCIDQPATGSLPSPERRALVIGTHTAALHEVIVFLEEVRRVGPSLVNPGLFPFTVMNAAAGLAAIHHLCQGPNITLNNGPTSALDALAYAADLVASDQADVAFAGGIESFGALTNAAFGRSLPPVTVAAVLAVTTPRHALALGGRANARLLAFATGEAQGLEPAAAREEIISAALQASAALAAQGSLGGPAAPDGSRPERVLLSLLEAARWAGAGPAGALIPVFAGPAEFPSGGALVLSPVSR